MKPTLVTYPGRSTLETTIVTGVFVTDNKEAAVLVTEVTPFHPLDPWWPDQPSDHGTIKIAGSLMHVLSAVLVGVNKVTSEIRIANAKGIKRSDDNWDWSVGHVVDSVAQDSFVAGVPCELSADVDFRRAISIGHTGCHIAALALNKAFERYWSKAIEKDSFGNNNFDQEAIISSRIGEYGSVDHYRLGKGVKKAGFSVDPFWQEFGQLASQVTKNANDILNRIGTISVTPNRTPFHERRTWKADHDGLTLEMPCGGVHVGDAKDIGGIEITLSRADDPSEFLMNTRSLPAR